MRFRPITQAEYQSARSTMHLPSWDHHTLSPRELMRAPKLRMLREASPHDDAAVLGVPHAL
jgi:hypothetical protein